MRRLQAVGFFIFGTVVLFGAELAEPAVNLPHRPADRPSGAFPQPVDAVVLALAKDKPRERGEVHDQVRRQAQDAERQREEQSRQRQAQRDQDRLRDQAAQRQREQQEAQKRKADQDLRDRLKRAQDQQQQQQQQRDQAAQRQREQQEAKNRKADQELRDRLKRAQDQQQQQQQQQRDQAAQRQREQQEAQKRKADQELRDRLKRAQDQQKQREVQSQGPEAGQVRQPRKKDSQSEQAGKKGQGMRPELPGSLGSAGGKGPVSERAKQALDKVLKSNGSDATGQKTPRMGTRDDRGTGVRRAQTGAKTPEKLGDLPVPRRDDLRLLPRADLHTVAEAATEELERKLQGHKAERGWRDHLKLDVVRKAVQSQGPPDPKTYKELRDVAGRLDLLARDDRYKTLRNDWGYQTLRQTVAELTVPPVVRERRQALDGAGLLRADLGRLQGGDRWRDFLKLEDLQRDLAFQQRIPGRDGDRDRPRDGDFHHHHHVHHHFWFGGGHWAFWHFRSRCFWGPRWRPPLPVGFALAFARFRQIHDDPRYVMIAQLPSFQATYANLQGYYDAWQNYPAFDWMADIAVVAAHWGAEPQGPGRLIPFVDFTVANLADAPATQPIRFVFARHFDQPHPWFGYPSVMLPALMPGESRIIRVRYPAAYPGELRQDARFPIWCEAVYDNFEWSKQNNRLVLRFGENFDAYAPADPTRAVPRPAEAVVILEARVPQPHVPDIFEAPPSGGPVPPDEPSAVPSAELPPPPAPEVPPAGADPSAPAVPRADGPPQPPPPPAIAMPAPPQTASEFTRALLLASHRPPELPRAESALLDRAVAALKAQDAAASAAAIAEFEKLAQGYAVDWTRVELTVVREALVDGDAALTAALDRLTGLLETDRQLVTHLEELGKLNDELEEGGSASVDGFEKLSASGEPAKPAIVWKPRRLAADDFDDAVAKVEQALDELWNLDGPYVGGRLGGARPQLEEAFKAFQALGEQRASRQSAARGE